MEEPKKFTEQESLAVISRMIKTAQNGIDDDSFYYLIWGWLVFAAALLNYFLMYSGYSQPFLPWAILMPLGGIVTAVYSYRHKGSQKVKTYIDDVMKYMVIAFLVSLFIVLFFMSKLGLVTYPMVMMVYGIWLFVSGGALRFQPLVIGGVINWVMAVIAMFSTFEMQLLLLSAAVLMGYIIPGHMLKARFKSRQSQVEAA
jgi:hypothetical protein